MVAAVWAYRGYKAYKAVKTTAKVVKAVKTVSKAKKTYKAVKATKKIVRAVKKVKSTKKIKKLVKKSSTKKIQNKVTKKLKKKSTFKKKDNKSPKKIQKRKNAGCFVAGTKVSTENGLVPIEKIKAGDRVWAEDTATGKKALKKVKKIFVREKDSLIRLSINGEIIETTEEHPFWIKEQGWIPAGSLKAGDIVKLQTGEYVPIETYEVVLLKEPIKVYNFHVEDYECYYVSEQKVLVHNTCNPIKGYTSHGINQAIGRDGGKGVSPKAILDTVKFPSKIVKQSEGRTKYISKKAVVVLNKDGKVITTYAKSSKYIRGKY